MNTASKPRIALTAIGLVVFLLGVLGGVARLSAQVSAPSSAIADHGILIVLGFFGTLAILVRRVQLRQKWSGWIPAVSLAASILALSGFDRAISGAVFALTGALLLLSLQLTIRATRRAVSHDHMQAAALTWIVASIAWAMSVTQMIVITWLAAFLVFIIAAERMDLARMLFRAHKAKIMRILLIASLIALLVNLFLPRVGVALFGIAMIAHAAALFFYDPARRMRRDASMTFMSNGVLIGYVWLAIGGALWIVSAVNGSLSDAAIHTLTLGFAAGMVFVHAPTVLIAVTKVKLKYHWLLYTHLLLLYAGLTVRIIGDMTGVLSVMEIGSYITAIACAVFVVSLIAGVVLARLRSAPQPRRSM